MKRYFVFGYYKYYPRGGMNDFLANFETEEEANNYVSDKRKSTAIDYDYDYYEVVDILDYT